MANILYLISVLMMLGMYTVAFTRVDMVMYENAMHVVKTVQAEQLVRSAIGIGLVRMGNNASVSNQSGNLVMGEGNATYTITRIGVTGTITASTTYYGVTVSSIAYVFYYHNRWRVQRIYY